MIKSKLDARERALELAVKCFDAHSGFRASNVVGFANTFERYLIGEAELPEVQSDTELVQAFLEVMNNEIEKKYKPNNPNYDELLKEIQTGNVGVLGKIAEDAYESSK